MRRRIYLAQVNNRFGPNIHLPYSVGLLWAYAKQFPEIADRYELVDFLYHKEPIEQALARIDRPDVLGLSSYIWNHRYNLELARAVKARWPECTIIMGGPHVPMSPSIEDFGKHPSIPAFPAIDFLVRGEGEKPFADLLRQLAFPGEDPEFPDWETWTLTGGAPPAGVSIPGIAPDTVESSAMEVPPNLEHIPSPYLTGVFDELMGRETGWQAPQETHRGCAYRCTFCEWGSSYYQKVRAFPTDRVVAEFEWFAKHKIEFIENSDANYGLLPRDLEMTEQMVKVKERTGYPKRFRAAFAKNSGDRVFAISKLLYDAGMHKATTVALQSMNDEVLTVIKRKNIKDAIEPLLERYRAAGIPTYSELILGLPGETLASFKRGVGELLDAGQHEALFIYTCVQLPNTPFSDPGYIKAHGIEYTNMQAMLLHATPEPGAITEIQPTVIATAAMPKADWVEGWMFAWAIHTFHCLGLTRLLAIDARDRISYDDFYTGLLEFAHSARGTVINRLYESTYLLLMRGIAGLSWDLVDPRFGTISWPPDEFAFLHAVLELDTFYDEIRPYVMRWCSERAFDEQRDAIVRPGDDLEAYARELVWYGRKGTDKRLRKKASDGDDRDS